MTEIYDRGVIIYGYSLKPFKILAGNNPMKIQYENGKAIKQIAP